MPDRTRRARPARKRPEARPPASKPALPDGTPSYNGVPPAPPSSNGHAREQGVLDGWSLVAAAIVVLGFGLRLLSLGGHPLGSSEATNALESLDLYRGQGGSAAAGPLLVYGQALVIALLGASDATLRLLPAVVGATLVAIPLLFERELGRIGARVAAFLLAMSPTLVYESRQNDAAMLVAGLALAAVAAYHVAVRDSNRRALAYCVVTLALLFASGPLAYYALVTFGAYLLLRGFLGRATAPAPATRVGFAAPAGPRLQGDSPFPASLRSAASPAALLLVFAAVFLVATTGVLGDLRGVQHGLVDGLSGWLDSLVQPSGRSPWYYLAVLVSYEQAPLLLGVLGILALRRNALAGLLVFWAVAMLVLGSLSQSRPIGLAAQLAIPLAILAGAYADRLLRSLGDPEARQGLLAFCLTSTVILAALGIALSVFSLPDPPVPEALLAIPILLAACALAYSVMKLGVARTLRHLLVVALAVGILWGWRENSMLSYGTGANPAQLLVGTATSPDVRQLAKDVGDIRDAIAMSRQDPGVLLSPDLPDTVSWYLRDTPNVTVGETPKSNTFIIVQPLDAEAPLGYVGERYRLDATVALQFDSWKELWRWYAYREAPTPIQSSDAMVYVRPVG